MIFNDLHPSNDKNAENRMCRTKVNKAYSVLPLIIFWGFDF